MSANDHNSANFDIRQHVECDRSGRAICPSCIEDGKLKQKNLSINLSTGAYRCWRGCTAEQIRAALGSPKPHRTSTPTVTPTRSRTISYSEVFLSQQRLLGYHDQPQQQARHWLFQRGFTEEMIQYYRLGLDRWQNQENHYWSIAIHIPANQEDQFYRKLRIAPWQTQRDLPKWSQLGVPATIFHTYEPIDAEATWFCEGEWDAMRLGWLARSQNAKVAVCCSTAGCGTVPPLDQLNELPGDVVIFFDRNDAPTKDGKIPGDAGALKLAEALGGRGKIAQVPMPEDCQVQGWDVSNALDAGFGWTDFVRAAQAATFESPAPVRSLSESLRHIVEQNESQFDREVALLNLAQQTRYTFRDLDSLAKTLSQEVEWESNRHIAKQKLRDLINQRPAPLNLNRFLEPWFAKILIDTAEAMPTAPEFLLTTLLPAAASRIGTAAQVVIKPSAKYTQPMIFWTAIVAQSGSLKTPAQRIILDPLVALEKDANDIHQAELENYERSKAAGETAKKPIRKRYLTKDSTLETLQRIHAENSRGILYYRDELAGAFKARNQYRGGQGADEEAELEQWNGAALIVDRAERSICIPKSAIGRTGNIQPDVLAELMGNHRDVNGAWSRWLFCAADAPLRYLNLLSDGPETTISETLTWLYLRLGELPKQDYSLSREAKFFFEAWQHQLVDAEQAEEITGLQPVYPKIEAYTARLALWLHIVNATLRQEQPTPLISGDTMERAVELAAYFLWQHRLIHLHNSPESGLATITLKIQKFAERVGSVTASRLKSGVRALRQTATHQIRQLMRTLSDLGYGSVIGEGTEMVYSTIERQNVAAQTGKTDAQMPKLSTAESQDNQSLQAVADRIDGPPVEQPNRTSQTPIQSEQLAHEVPLPEQLAQGTAIEVWFDQIWVKAIYVKSLDAQILSERTQELDSAHKIKLEINSGLIQGAWSTVVALADIRLPSSSRPTSDL